MQKFNLTGEKGGGRGKMGGVLSLTVYTYNMHATVSVVARLGAIYPGLILFGSSLSPGAEAIPDIDVAKKRFAMNIILPSSDETGEIRLVFDSVSRQLFLCNQDYILR